MKAISEIKRIKKLMGLKPILKEGYHQTKRYILREDTGGPLQKFIDDLSSALAKNTQTLTDEEISALKSFLDEINVRKGLNLELTGDIITPTLRSAINNAIGAVDDNIMKEMLSVSARRFQDRLISIGAGNLTTISAADVVRNIFETEAAEMYKKTTTQMGISTQEVVSGWDFLVYMQSRGGKLEGAFNNPNLYDTVKNNLFDLIDKMDAKGIDETNPIRMFAENLYTQADEISTSGGIRGITDEVPTEKMVTDVKKMAESGLEEVIDEPLERVEFDPNVMLDQSDTQLVNQVKEAVMQHMQDICDEGICVSLIAMWKAGNPKFTKFWEEFQTKLLDTFKSQEAAFSKNIDVKGEQKLQKVLDAYQSKYGRKFTEAEYMQIGEKIWDELRKNGQLGWVNQSYLLNLKTFFSTPDMIKRTLTTLVTGSDPFTGRWTWQGMFKRWVAFNVLWTGVVFVYYMREYNNEGPQPGESTTDAVVRIFKKSVSSTLGSAIGLPPLGRLLLFTTTSAIESIVVETVNYVSWPDLKKYILKNNPDFTPTGLEDKLFEKGLVKFRQDDDPPYTEISGATEVYAKLNGKYSMVKDTIWDVFGGRIVFEPDESQGGEKDEKEIKIDKDIRNKGEEAIENATWAKDKNGDSVYEKGFLGISNGISYVGNKKIKLDDGSETLVLIYKVKHKDLKEIFEISLKYNEWLEAGSPRLDDKNLKTYTIWKSGI